MEEGLSTQKQRVWDVPVRLMHWGLVASVVAAWMTAESIGSAHEYIGYCAAALVALRIVWGYRGNRYARWRQFVRSPAVVVAYVRAVLNGRAARHIGHNPLGGWMVLALIGCIALLTASGYAATTDLLWGYAWPVRLHVAIGWTLVALIVMHVSGVLYTSAQHHENLVSAMITGNKKPAEPDDQD